MLQLITSSFLINWHILNNFQENNILIGSDVEFALMDERPILVSDCTI